MKLDIIGKAIAQAADVLDQAGFSYRVVSRDGKQYMVTANFDRNRVNLVMVEGKVTEYSFG